MSSYQDELDRLRGLCPRAELWDEAGLPLVYLPDMRIGDDQGPIDLLLCPRTRDGYDTRLFFSRQLSVERNWSAYVILTGNWYTFSWNGIASSQPWLDILGAHLGAAR